MKRFSSLVLTTVLMAQVVCVGFGLPAHAQSSMAGSMVGPSGPVARQEKPKAPVKPLKATVGEATGQVADKVKAFFENTGRTVNDDGEPIAKRVEAQKAAEARKQAEQERKESLQELAAKRAAAASRPPVYQENREPIGGLLGTPPPLQPEIEKTAEAADLPPIMMATRIDNADNPLGLQVARTRLEKLKQHLKQPDGFVTHKNELFTLRQWLIEATEAHVTLYQVLGKVPDARVQAEFEKQLALEFAKLRDEVLFQTGRYYAATNQKQKAVKELVEVIQSQAQSDLGLQAYQVLQSIGFTEQLRLTASQ